MQLSIIGIDLGKTSCSLVGVDTAGKVLVRRRMRRDTVVAFCSKYPGSIVAMEACCGAHHIGRTLAAKGFEIRLMSPEYVRPYVKAQKNDDRDAEAIAEAAGRPTMRFVTLKSEEQLDMQTLHRVRDRLVGDRTSLMNQIRSLLLERGHIVAQGARQAGRRPCRTARRGGTRPGRADPRADWRHALPMGRARRAHQGLRRGVRRRCQGAGRGEAPPVHTRHRRAERHGPGGGHRRRGHLRPRTGPRGLARPRAATGDDGGPPEAPRHHQAREQVPPQDADPGRAIRAADAEGGGHACGRLASRAARAGASEHGRGGSGCQDGSHRVGAAAARRCLQGRARGISGGLKPDRLTRTGVGPRCLWVATRRWPDCQPVSWNPPAKNGTRCRPLYKDQDARLSILANGSPEGRIRLCRQIKLDPRNHLPTGRAIRFIPVIVASEPDAPLRDEAPTGPKPRRRRRRGEEASIEVEIDGVVVRVGRHADARVIAAVIGALKAGS